MKNLIGPPVMAIENLRKAYKLFQIVLGYNQVSLYNEIWFYIWKAMEKSMTRKYPAFIYWLSHIGSPAVVCLFCYMPISAASDLICVFFTERVTDLFRIWRNTFKLFCNDSVTLIDSTCGDSHQEHEFSKQTRCLTLILGLSSLRTQVWAYIFDIFGGLLTSIVPEKIYILNKLCCLLLKI